MNSFGRRAAPSTASYAVTSRWPPAPALACPYPPSPAAIEFDLTPASASCQQRGGTEEVRSPSSAAQRCAIAASLPLPPPPPPDAHVPRALRNHLPLLQEACHELFHVLVPLRRHAPPRLSAHQVLHEPGEGWCWGQGRCQGQQSSGRRVVPASCHTPSACSRCAP